MSNALIPLDLGPAPLPYGDAEALEVLLHDRLRPLSEMQQKLVLAMVDCGGDRDEAARRAGYQLRVADLNRKVFAKPEVQAAIEVAIAYAEARNPMSKASLTALLEQALRVDPGQYYIYAADQVTPIGLKPLSTLSAAHRLRLKSATVRVRKSPGGRLARPLTVEVQLVPADVLIDRLIKLRGWAEEAPLVDISIGGNANAPLALSSGRSPRWCEELVEALYPDDGELRAFIDLPDEKKATAVRERLKELRRVGA